MLLTACRSYRQVTQNSDSKKEVLKEKKTVYKDTVFFTNSAKTSFNIPISEISNRCTETLFKPRLNGLSTQLKEKPKTKVWTQKNGNATAKIELKGDSLKISAECDSLAIAAKIKEYYEKEFTNSESNSNNSREEKTGTGFFGGFVNILIALIVGFVLGKLIKF